MCIICVCVCVCVCVENEMEDLRKALGLPDTPKVKLITGAENVIDSTVPVGLAAASAFGVLGAAICAAADAQVLAGGDEVDGAGEEPRSPRSPGSPRSPFLLGPPAAQLMAQAQASFVRAQKL